MTDTSPEGRPPDGEEQAQEASAGEPRESGSEATREALASPEPYRLSEEELDARDERFSGPRKEQGPPLEGGGPSAEEAVPVEEVDETLPPEEPSEG